MVLNLELLTTGALPGPESDIIYTWGARSPTPHVVVALYRPDSWTQRPTKALLRGRCLYPGQSVPRPKPPVRLRRTSLNGSQNPDGNGLIHSDRSGSRRTERALNLTRATCPYLSLKAVRARFPEGKRGQARVVSSCSDQAPPTAPAVASAPPSRRVKPRRTHHVGRSAARRSASTSLWVLQEGLQPGDSVKAASLACCSVSLACRSASWALMAASLACRSASNSAPWAA